MLGSVRGAVCNLVRNTVSRRNLTSTRSVRSQEPVHPGYKTIRAKQEKFSTEDGTPVHLKGGPMDSILYGVTVVACVGAVALEGYEFYQFAQK